MVAALMRYLQAAATVVVLLAAVRAAPLESQAKLSDDVFAQGQAALADPGHSAESYGPHGGAALSRRALQDATAANNAPGGETPVAGGCTPSTEADFDCMVGRLDGVMTLHYNSYQAGDTGAKFGLEMPSTRGWASLGFPQADEPTKMVGSVAVIVTESAGPSGIGVFSLDGQDVEDQHLLSTGNTRRLAQDSFPITETTVERANDRTFATFTRPFDDTFTADAAAKPYIAAAGGSDTLSMHTIYSDFELALDAAVAPESDAVDGDLAPLYALHAWTMTIAWGGLIPLGILMSLTMKSYGKVSEKIGPIWFLGHRICNLLGLLLSTVGFAVAVAKFDLVEEYLHHKEIGYAVFIMGWIQPINAFLRPHVPAPGEKRSRLRLGWEFLHKGLGYSALVLGIINIFSGIPLRYDRETWQGEDDKNRWRIIFGIWLGLLAILGLVLFFIGRRLKKKRYTGPKGPVIEGQESIPSAMRDVQAPSMTSSASGSGGRNLA